ncbi:MAG TPA: cytochrome c oxidase accessory protein CcoG [Holophagaceae bacterium]|nr:cytochrome c oxidase accessory protein CcoG [Holophagaceae bacterium]
MNTSPSIPPPATAGRGKFSYMYPAEVKGRFDRLRSLAFAGLILVYLLLPWFRIHGEQALLLDVARRRFHIFGLNLWAHEAPLLFLILGGAAFALCFITAIWGRIWCGYACPQTVFITSIFRRIERWIEGTHLERKRLDEEGADQPMWVLKKALKWGAFTLVSLFISHSFLAYFVGTDRLRQAMTQPPGANWTLFLVMAFIAGFILVDFGWVRERLCFTLCPYGRFQTVLMDRHSLAVVYDPVRGEPRRGSVAHATGDCVACDRCVQVCPTNIDIRNGVQMECIACTACVDACDDVMARIKKPLGLIRYDTEAGLAGESHRASRPRPLIYLGLTVLLWGVLGLLLLTRAKVDIVQLRAKGTPYQQVVDPAKGARIINHLKFDLTNLVHEDQEVAIAFPPADAARGFEVITATNPVPVPLGKAVQADLFVAFPKDRLDFGKTTATLEFREGGKVINRQELTLVGPYQ